MSDIGDILRDARQSKHLSVLEVAEATRIKASYLEALEHGDYGLLPGPAYVTGFLRNYATFLGMHPDDIVQEYHAHRPAVQPAVKPATRVLASGHERRMRGRVLWVLSAVLVLFAGGFAIKQYDDTYAKVSPPQIKLTPANLGMTRSGITRPAVTKPIYLHLRSLAPVWVRVTVDDRRAFQGILRPGQRHMHWKGNHAIYVITYDGAHIRATYDGRSRGPISRQPGLIVEIATPSGWHRAA